MSTAAPAILRNWELVPSSFKASRQAVSKDLSSNSYWDIRARTCLKTHETSLSHYGGEALILRVHAKLQTERRGNPMERNDMDALTVDEALDAADAKIREMGDVPAGTRIVQVYHADHRGVTRTRDAEL